MSDKAAIEAARAKIRAAKAANASGATATEGTKRDSAIELARQKLRAAKAAKEGASATSASPTAAGGAPPPAPLPRLKGDARPVEPVSGVSAVAPDAAAPAPGVSAAATEKPGGLTALFKNAARINPIMAPLVFAAEAAQGAQQIGLTPFKKSVQTARRDLEAGKALVGAGDAEGFVREQQELDAIKYDADLEKRMREYSEIEPWQKVGYLFNNKDVFAAMMGEQAANAAITTGSALAGAVVGSVVPGPGTVIGGTTGLFASSMATRAAEAVSEFMQEKGIDSNNREQVEGLFANPEAMSELRAYAAKTGVVVGAVDAFVSMLGMKGAGGAIAKPFVKPFVKPIEKILPDGKIVKQVVPGPIAEGTANLALDAAGGGLGEAGGMLWSRGEVDVSAVVDEVIFGTAAGLGQSTVSTMIARRGRSGRAPTAEEIAESGIVMPGMEPPETFVTPEEAAAEGRALFGFAENDSQDPVELGTYDEAEKKAGAGDIRRGKIIAVKEDEAAAPVTKDEILQAVDNPEQTVELSGGVTQKALFAMRDRLGKAFGERGRALYAEIQNAVNRYDLAVANSDPTTARQIFEQKLDNILSKAPRGFSGDRKGRGVLPKVRNLIPVDAFEMGVGGVVPEAAAQTAAQKNVVDADKLQSELKARGWNIVPGNIKRIIYGNARMEKLLDTTFTFTTPAARQSFIDGNLVQRTALMKSGDVKWTGKLDGRFFAANEYLSLKDREITILDETGAEVGVPEAAKFLNDLREPSLGTDMMDQRQIWGQRQYPDADDYPQLTPEFKALLGDKPGSFKVLGLSQQFAKYTKVIEIWHKKFSIRTPTLYVEIVQDANGNLKLPPEMAAYPQLSAFARKGTVGASGYVWDLGDGGRILGIVTKDGLSTKSDTSVYSTLAHEMGHVISSEHFASAPLEVRNKIFAAYRRFVLANPLSPQMYEQFQRRRFALPKGQGYYNYGQVDSGQVYYLRFEEWFAEQVARWGDTNSRPLGVVGKFFRSLAKQITALYRDARKRFGKLESRAEAEMDQYLNAVWDGADVLTNWPENAVNVFEQQSRKANSKFDSEPVSQHGATANVSSVLKSLENQPFMNPAQKSLLGAVRAGVDRYNWFYEWALNLRQLAARNPHIQELSLANELFDFAKLDANRIMVEAEGYLKRWRKRSAKQQAALGELLFELDQMTYLQPNENPRWPTPAEFTAMVQRLQLDADTLALYRDIRDFFLNSLRRQEELQIQEAMRITDPKLQANAIKSAQDMSRALLQRPYFPQMRFGKWSLTIKDAQSGKLEHFELFETKGELRRALEAAAKQYPSGQWTVEGSTVPQEMQPFMGVPPWMLDKLRDMPGLTKPQQDWLESFRYMLAPAQSFRKRMMHRKNYEGFSTAARRVFANYAFHHARFYSRIKHDWDLRQAIDSLRHSRNSGLAPTEISDRKRMADFVERIYKEFRNPSQDWTALRVLNAIWHLGFVPASAIVNLSQTVIATAPYLSAKFGAARGEAALMNSARKLSTYYKQGSYAGMLEPEFKAIAKAVEDGFIDESMAAELAASAVGSGGGLRVGNGRAQELLSLGWQQFSEKAMWMFRMAEQWNRRVSFRAARQLAYDNPGLKWVQDMRVKHFLKYDQLMKAGWTDREAVSYLAGIETLLETHYTYDRLARPRFMQGRKSVLFAFYMFTQNSLFMLWHNKDMIARYMLYMAIIAGPMGLVPDDVEDVLNAIASKLFGKQFNLEREARKLISDLLDDESHVPPDLLLHGASRYSFGLSLAGDVLGAKFVPEVDMSKSLTLSRALPLNVTSLIKPAADWNEKVANVTRDAAGAAYGIPLAMTKAVAGSDLDIADFKRWEGAMPRAFRQATRAGRLAVEGGERTPQMARTIPYDYSDPKQLGELLAIAAGFTPTKQSQYWDRQLAEKEIDFFWKSQKQMIFEQLYEARFVYDDKEAFKQGIQKVKDFNARAPKGYQITPNALQSSLKNRVRRKTLIERGDNPNIGPGVAEESRRLYPEGEIIQQKPVQ